jgi:hypothetical protein
VRETAGPVMAGISAGILASIVSAPLSSPASGRDGQDGPYPAIRGFWRQFFARAFDPYRPELHYMRGPGKQAVLSPAVQSMVAEIRAAKALGNKALGKTRQPA